MAEGRRVTLSDLRTDTTVGELREVLALADLSIDGVPVDDDRPLADLDDLRVGSRLGRRLGPRPEIAAPIRDGDTLDDPLEFAVVTGPDCSQWTSLPSGRHVVGRSRRADIAIDDPSIEAHHALLDVRADGVCFTQLSGNVPARRDGRPIEPGERVDAGERLRLGASTLAFRRPAGRRGETARGPVRADRAPLLSGSIASHPHNPWRRVVRRAPATGEVPPERSVELPRRGERPGSPPATGLIGAAVAAFGALVIATVMDNALFVLFAALGALTALATWGAGWVTALRARRRVDVDDAAAVERFRCDLEEARAARRSWHLARHPAPADVLAAVARRSPEIWMQRVRRDEPLVATVGSGAARWRLDIADDRGSRDVGSVLPTSGAPDLLAAVGEAQRLEGVPVPISVGPEESVAIHGPAQLVSSLVRSVVVQLATAHGPADWRLLVVSSDPPAWEWADWLPHGIATHGAVVHAGDDAWLSEQLDGVAADSRDRYRLLVVVDHPVALSSRQGPLRRFIDRVGAAVLAVVDVDDTVPACCARTLHVGATGCASWTGGVPVDDEVDGPLVVAGISRPCAEEASRRLAPLVDPEMVGDGSEDLPASVSFGRLWSGGSVPAPAAVLRRWSAGGVDPAPRAVIGSSANGAVELDLARDGPHGLVAGTTGSGKSELLRSMVLGLALESSPRHLQFVLVDYKGGSTFDACAELPHTVGLVTDLDDGLAERALSSLTAELHRRERLLRACDAADLTEHRRRAEPDETIARLVVVIDEFAALAVEHPDVLSALVDIARRGRSLGVHLILATQRPAGVVSDDIRANTSLRIALRLNDRADAMDVVADDRPVHFPRDAPGRVALRVGSDDVVVVQSAWSSGPPPGELVERPTVRHPATGARGSGSTGHASPGAAGPFGPTELQTYVAAIVDAAALGDITVGQRPWLPPLPHPLTDLDEFVEDPDTVGVGVGAGVDAPARTGGALGLIDDPTQQCRRPLRWTPHDGSLAVIGSIGSGTTSTLIAIAASVCRDRRADEVHLYVVDARGDDRLSALGALAHCGGVIRPHEGERLHRLLARLVEEISRRTEGEHGPPVVLMVDGWSSVRSTLGAVDRSDDGERLQRIVADGPSVGVVTVACDDVTPAMSALPHADRWVLGLTDPAAARTVGVATAPIRLGTPGRLRLASCGREAQVALGAPGLASISTREHDASGPESIVVLPDDVRPDPGDPRWSSIRRSGQIGLTVGVGAARLEPVHLSVARAVSVLVVGDARSGVSTTLSTVANAWSGAHAGGAARVVRVEGATGRESLGRVADALDDVRPMLVVIDDAHRVDDVDGLLGSIVRGERFGVHIVAGARSDAVRSSYGHWTRELARARCGVVMTSRSDESGGDVFGVTIPRRPMVAARPGLAWLVDDEPLRQAQIARVDP